MMANNNNVTARDVIYHVNDFAYFQADEYKHGYYYSIAVSAKITHEKVAVFLSHLARLRLKEIKQRDLIDLFQRYNLDTNIQDYLQQQLQLFVPIASDRFEHLYVISDNPSLGHDLCAECITGYGLDVMGSDAAIPISTRNSLIVLFNQNYRRSNFTSIYQSSRQPDSYFVTAYIIHKYLIIDNIYNCSKGVPCHFCNFDRRVNNLMANPISQKTSWYNFYQSVLQTKADIVPVIPMTKAREGIILFSLVRFIKAFLATYKPSMYLEEVNESHCIDLETGDVAKNASVHWPHCECVYSG